MSEYIVDFSAKALCDGVHEEIVRCKDCKFYDTSFVRYSDKPIFECLAEWCEGSEGDHPLVEPYGFCAWGERRDA